MATLDELARLHTALEPTGLGHLKRLVGAWGMLSDLCFADLLLLVPVAQGPGSRFIVLGQVRPTTSQTLHREDLVGRILDEAERPLVARGAAARGDRRRGDRHHAAGRTGPHPVHPGALAGRGPGRADP